MAAVSLPPDDAEIYEIFRFATHTYAGYVLHGGVEGLGSLANRIKARWHESGVLPADADDIRAALFFEARRWHHYGYEPDDQADRYVRALLAQLRISSGAAVEPKMAQP
jgi:hypothetical protein